MDETRNAAVIEQEKEGDNAATLTHTEVPENVRNAVPPRHPSIYASFQYPKPGNDEIGYANNAISAAIGYTRELSQHEEVWRSTGSAHMLLSNWNYEVMVYEYNKIWPGTFPSPAKSGAAMESVVPTDIPRPSPRWGQVVPDIESLPRNPNVTASTEQAKPPSTAPRPADAARDDPARAGEETEVKAPVERG